jgi:DNA-directed RNA polymerase specialized sigma24 family protein
VPFNQAYSESLHDAHQLPDKAAEIALVMDALNRLPAKTKETVLLFDLADLSLEDIRVIQGGTLSGVKSRLRRGHEELRSRLGVESQDESEVMVKTATLEVLPSTAGNHVNIMEGMGKYVL